MCRVFHRQPPHELGTQTAVGHQHITAATPTKASTSNQGWRKCFECPGSPPTSTTTPRLQLCVLHASADHRVLQCDITALSNQPSHTYTYPTSSLTRTHFCLFRSLSSPRTAHTLSLTTPSPHTHTHTHLELLSSVTAGSSASCPDKRDGGCCSGSTCRG